MDIFSYRLLGLRSLRIQFSSLPQNTNVQRSVLTEHGSESSSGSLIKLRISTASSANASDETEQPIMA